jgi:hypothetical protein
MWLMGNAESCGHQYVVFVYPRMLPSLVGFRTEPFEDITGERGPTGLDETSRRYELEGYLR